MDESVGIRALKQNASAVVARTAAGERLVVTDRGRPVARLSPLPRSPLEELLESGQARPPRARLVDLARPVEGVVVEVSVSDDLAAAREQERW